jgi:hypothetical protein
MKKLLVLFFCIFALSAEAQYVDKMEEVITLPTNPLPLHKYVYQGNVYVFADGTWNIIDNQSTSTYAITAFGGTGSIDSTLWLKKWREGLYTLLTDSRLTDTRVPRSHSHTATDVTGTAVLTNDLRLSDSRPASDVYLWAKASAKPTYTFSEVGACSSLDVRLSDSRTPLTHTHTESDITNLTTDISTINTNISGKQATLTRNTGLITYTALSNGTTAMALGTNSTVKVTPNATATYTTTVPAAGCEAFLIILTSGTNSYTITFGTGFKTTGTLVTGTVTAKVFVLEFISDGTTLNQISRTTAM